MTNLPDMPEVEPDDGDLDRHDAHYRLNPKGHKELVVKKKGEPDEETLNEIAESLIEMAGEYAELEDNDQFANGDSEFARVVINLDEDGYNQIIQTDGPTMYVSGGKTQFEGQEVQSGVQLRYDYAEERPATQEDISTIPPDVRTGLFYSLFEDEYSGLEDNDEFSEYGEEDHYTCSNCQEDRVWPDGGSHCEECDNSWCEQCISAFEDKTGRVLDRCSDGGAEWFNDSCPCPSCFENNGSHVNEGVAFGGPAPAMSPEQQGYQRDFRPSTPSGVSDTGPTQIAGDHEAERIAQDSPNSMTSTTPQAADGPELSRIKSKVKATVMRGIGPRNKYIAGNRGDGGDGLDYGATHSESFTGTAAIAIGPYDVLDNEEDKDTDTSESLMARRKKTLLEWEPKFAGGGDYNPGDYQMPSAQGDGVADKKPTKDKVGAFDTDTSNDGEAWPRDHNETAAMCDVDDDGVENKPQGSHESSVGEPTDGHQTPHGHNWPDEAKNTGSGVAEPFEGDRWSDGGTLSGGSAQDEMTNDGKPQKMPSSGTITGTSGPQYGQMEGRWTPKLFATMMEGEVNLQHLFDAYANDGREAVCVDDFQMLLNAHRSGAQIDEQVMLQLMQNNQQYIFYEGVDANGPYWVATAIAVRNEGKPFPGAAEPFGSKDSDSDDSDDSDSDSDSSDDSDSDDDSGKPWESRRRGRAVQEGKPFPGAAEPFGSDDSDSDSDDDDDDSDSDDDDDSGKPWESRRRGRAVSEDSGCTKCNCDPCECEGEDDDCMEEGYTRRPFGQMINELQNRPPEREADLYKGGVTDDPSMLPPGLSGPGSITGGPLDSIPGDDFQPGMHGEFDAADPGMGGMGGGLDDLGGGLGPEMGMGDELGLDGGLDGGLGDELGGGLGPDMGMGGGLPGMDDASLDACPECGYNGPGGEEDCPECGAPMGGGMGDEDVFGPGQGLGAGQDPDMDYDMDHGYEPSFDESRKIHSPKINESLRRFMVSARSIIGRNQGHARGSIAEALNHSWDYYAGSVNPNRCASKVQNSLQGLMKKFPGFSPLTEDNEFTDSPESKAMDSADGAAIGGGGSANNKSSYLPEADSDTKEEGEAWPRSHRTQSSPEETPIIKGTAKGMEGTGGNAKTVKENVTRLSQYVKKCLTEGSKGLRGKYDVRFTCLVQESNGKINRTNTRIRLAEALADAEELLQVYPADQVVLESYYGQKGQCLRKYDIPMTPIKVRGPLVSGNQALFRFNKTAERYADNLVAEGFTCRVCNHNWGRSVLVMSENKKWMKNTQGKGKTPMTESRRPRRRRRRRRATA